MSADMWHDEESRFIFSGHIPAIIAFLVYIIVGTAETNRGPFDLPEAESEIYCWLPYGILRYPFSDSSTLAEYLNLFIVRGVAALLFFGGWMPFHIPGWDAFNRVMDYIPSFVWFLLKAVPYHL